MFVYQDENHHNINKTQNSYIVVNSHVVKVNKEVCCSISKKLQTVFEKETIRTKDLTFNIHDFHYSKVKKGIANIFQGRPITINKSNIQDLTKIANYFEIQSLSDFLLNLIFDKEIINKHFVNNSLFTDFLTLEEAILNISVGSKIQESAYLCMILISRIGENIFFNTLFHIFSKSKSIQVHQIISLISIIQENNPKLIEKLIVFIKTKFQNVKVTKAILLVLHELYHKKMIPLEILYEIFEINQNYPFLFIDIFKIDLSNFESIYVSEHELELLYQENFELHQKGIEEGHSQDTILSLIRQDDADSLQNLLLHSDLQEIAQKKSPNEYEKILILDSNRFSLIDYAVFFGSSKCLNYFLSNNLSYQPLSSLKYAIAGGNHSFITLFLREKKELFTKNNLDTAIKYHQHCLFEWLYINQHDFSLSNFIDLTMNSYNFKSLFFLIENGFSLYDYFLSAVKSNNLALFHHSEELFLELHINNYINHLKNYVLIFWIKCFYKYSWNLF